MSGPHPLDRRRRVGRPPSARATKRRLVGLCVTFLLMFTAVVIRLADVQVVHPGRYVSLGVRQRFVSKQLPAGRGALLDRNGVELALSLPQKSVFADPEMVGESGKLHQTATALSPLVHRSVADLEATMTGKGRYVLLAHTVAPAVAASIEKLHLAGIGTFDEFKRYQPSGDVGRSVLGRVSTDGTKGSSGLEEQYDSVLTGKPGSITYERRGTADGGTDRGGLIAGGRQRVDKARPGSDLVLTLDRSMQYQAEQTLEARVAATGAKGGMAIVSRPSTGEILAMANVTAEKPDGTLGPAVPSSNNASLTATFEPGSVNKVITMAAALEAGQITPTTKTEVPDHLQVADHEFTDHDEHPAELWTPTDILVTSSNVGTIEIAQRLGKTRLDAALRRFGLGRSTGLDFPQETRGSLLAPQDWSGTSLGSISIGQGISVTAMQMLEAFNVVANDGEYVAPRLVDAIVHPDGTKRRMPASAHRRVVSENTAAMLRAMMTKVVSEQTGTGTRAQVPGYNVAGKTGTARKPVTPSMPDNGYMDLNGRYHYVATFAGFVPAEKPELSIIVVIDEPDPSKGGYFASDVSAPAFSELARYALRLYDIPPASVSQAAGVPDVSESAKGYSDAPLPEQAPTTTEPAETTATTAPTDGVGASTGDDKGG
ncbi:MAG: penicillin-binding protein 2 [Acidimicrobiia bacterium]|nr:penicillin-binding protein 2 [Acidimicrobiia bacterium]